VQPGSDTAHAEEHDAEEARLEEERGQHLEANQRTDDRSGELREFREGEPELERQHDAGHHADGEAHREDVQPEPVDLLVQRVAGLQPQALDEHEEPHETDR
jgi:hypothetical protein